MTGDDFLNRAQVADLLKITVKKFMEIRPALEAQGFPVPAFGTRQGERWDPWAITAYRKRQIPREQTETGAPIEISIADELDRRAATLAAGRSKGGRPH